MGKLRAEWRKYVLGLSILLSVLIGGAAGTGLWTDSLLECVLILSAAAVLASGEGEPVDPRVRLFLALVVAAVAVQLIPLPAGVLDEFRSQTYTQGRLEAASEVDFISLGLGRTVDSFVYVCALVAFCMALFRLKGEQLHALLPFFIAGVACHIVAAALQYSASETVQIETILPYTIRAGLFSNRNHFASLMYVALPFLLYIGTFRGMTLWSGLAMAMVCLVLLAAGSRAGAVLGVAAIVSAAMLLASRTRLGVGALVTLVAIAGIYAVGTWTLLDGRDMDPAFGRMEFARSAILGIRENWLTGVGYGNFTNAYQAFETQNMIFERYVNLAHDDYLQLVFEGGLLAAFLIFGYLMLLLSQIFKVRHSHFQKAAFLGILFILVHSTVDYPLRTLTVAVSFAYLNAILFHTALRPQATSLMLRVKVRHEDRELTVPLAAADL